MSRSRLKPNDVLRFICVCWFDVELLIPPRLPFPGQSWPKDVVGLLLLLESFGFRSDCCCWSTRGGENKLLLLLPPLEGCWTLLLGAAFGTADFLCDIKDCCYQQFFFLKFAITTNYLWRRWCGLLGTYRWLLQPMLWMLLLRKMRMMLRWWGGMRRTATASSGLFRVFDTRTRPRMMMLRPIRRRVTRMLLLMLLLWVVMMAGMVVMTASGCTTHFRRTIRMWWRMATVRRWTVARGNAGRRTRWRDGSARFVSPLVVWPRNSFTWNWRIIHPLTR